MITLYSIKLTLHSFLKMLQPVRGRFNQIENRSSAYNLKFDVVGNNNTVVIGECKIHNSLIKIRGNCHNLVIEDGCYLKNTILLIEDNACAIKIGKNTTIEGAEIDVKENGNKIIIGQNCMFSKDIYITSSDSHSVLIKDSDTRINFGKEVFIDSNVWLGRGTMVLKGSKIGSGSVIAAGSIVTGKLENNSIYAGSPVKKIKEDVQWLRPRV